MWHKKKAPDSNFTSKSTTHEIWEGICSYPPNIRAVVSAGKHIWNRSWWEGVLCANAEVKIFLKFFVPGKSSNKLWVNLYSLNLTVPCSLRAHDSKWKTHRVCFEFEENLDQDILSKHTLRCKQWDFVHSKPGCILLTWWNASLSQTYGLKPQSLLLDEVADIVVPHCKKTKQNCSRLRSRVLLMFAYKENWLEQEWLN